MVVKNILETTVTGTFLECKKRNINYVYKYYKWGIIHAEIKCFVFCCFPWFHLTSYFDQYAWIYLLKTGQTQLWNLSLFVWVMVQLPIMLDWNSLELLNGPKHLQFNDLLSSKQIKKICFLKNKMELIKKKIINSLKFFLSHIALILDQIFVWFKSLTSIVMPNNFHNKGKLT